MSPRADDLEGLGFFVAVVLAVPISLALWAVLIRALYSLAHVIAAVGK